MRPSICRPAGNRRAFATAPEAVRAATPRPARPARHGLQRSVLLLSGDGKHTQFIPTLFPSSRLRALIRHQGSTQAGMFSRIEQLTSIKLMFIVYCTTRHRYALPCCSLGGVALIRACTVVGVVEVGSEFGWEMPIRTDTSGNKQTYGFRRACVWFQILFSPLYRFMAFFARYCRQTDTFGLLETDTLGKPREYLP